MVHIGATDLARRRDQRRRLPPRDVASAIAFSTRTKRANKGVESVHAPELLAAMDEEGNAEDAVAITLVERLCACASNLRLVRRADEHLGWRADLGADLGDRALVTNVSPLLPARAIRRVEELSTLSTASGREVREVRE